MSNRPRSSRALAAAGGLLVLVGLAIAPIQATSADRRASSAWAEGIESAAALPQRFEAHHGLAAQLQSARGQVRVTVTLRTPSVLDAAQRQPATAAALSGRMPSAQQAALRRADELAARRYARRAQVARARAVHALSSAAARWQRAAAPARRAINRAGGRVRSIDPVSGTLTAIVPARALRALAARSDVAAVDPARMQRALSGGLAADTATTGVATWWTNNHLGGSGSADTRAATVAVFDETVQLDHPAFSGLNLQRPAPDGTSGDTHGTTIAAIIASRGASGCGICIPADADDKGVAPGLTSLLDAHTPSNYSAVGWALGIDQASLAGADPAALVFSDSHGSPGETNDDFSLARSRDALTSVFGVLYTEAAGNTGPGGGTLGDTCYIHNLICVGSYADNGGGHANDHISDFSSRGPTPGGRKKPDLVALGGRGIPDGNPNNDGQVTEARADWQSSGQLWGANNGTSYAAPRVAGAAAVLIGAGITDPLAVKAILIDSARPGRATPASVMGTQATWQPDWGWGELDLDAAYQQRANFATASLDAATSNDAGVRFYAATTTTTGDRATLTWNRRAVRCIRLIDDPNCLTYLNASSAYTLSNLDLYEYDRNTQALRAQSTSSIDNVEQLRSPAAADVIYKVANASSTVDGLPAEPFALAATRPLSALTTPVPAVSLNASASQARPGQDVSVSATVTNTSTDMAADDAQVALQLPSGVDLVSGAATQGPGSLAPSGQYVASWTVRGSTDGLKQLTAAAQQSRYASTFTASVTRSLLVDGTPPNPTISAPAGEQTSTTIPVSWGATDPTSGVKDYDVEVSLDSGPFTALATATMLTATTYTGQAGHSYVFRVRARDQLDNTSPYATSAAITIATPPPADRDRDGVPDSRDRCPTVPASSPDGCPPKTRANLRLAAVRWARRALRVIGTLSRASTGRVKITLRCSRRGTRARAIIRRGRFATILRVPAACDSARTAHLIVIYPGNARVRSQVLRATVRRARQAGG